MVIKSENENRPRHPHDGDGHRHHEEDDAENVDPGLRPLREAMRDDVDAHMFIFHECVASAHQKDKREQIPLYFEIGVGAVIDRVPHHRVAGADQRHDQNDPDDAPADKPGNRVNELREFEQCFQKMA